MKVTKVAPASVAESVGLAAGDVIQIVDHDGRAIDDLSEAKRFAIETMTNDRVLCIKRSFQQLKPNKLFTTCFGALTQKKHHSRL